MKYLHILKSNLVIKFIAIILILISKYGRRIKFVWNLLDNFYYPLSHELNYMIWILKYVPTKNKFLEMGINCNKLKYRPKISILIPTYNSNIHFLSEAIDSVINQIYTNWEICISDDASNSEQLKKRIVQDKKKKDNIFL